MKEKRKWNKELNLLKKLKKKDFKCLWKKEKKMNNLKLKKLSKKICLLHIGKKV